MAGSISPHCPENPARAVCNHSNHAEWRNHEMAEERKTGTVKWFSRVKGYGFIAPDNEEQEIFVHFSGIEGEGFRNLEKGQRVSFQVEQTEKGPQAISVRDETLTSEYIAEPDQDDQYYSAEESSRDEEEATMQDEDLPDIVA
jgi:CspA family cold shock protein